MTDDAVCAAFDAVDLVAELSGSEFGEEAEPTQIDSDDRDLIFAELPAGTQDGTVASEDDRQIGLDGIGGCLRRFAGDIGPGKLEGRRDAMNGRISSHADCT